MTEPQDTPSVSEPLPRRFGRYVLFDQIGVGGMAQIYLGRTETELGGQRLSVVKQILPVLSSSAEFSRLLIEEAKLAAQLSHSNIAQVTDLGREGEVLYIAMEYVEGFDLRELLRRCSKSRVPLPVEFALLITTETLRALDYAHRKKSEGGQPLNIVHRDVSPSNVLVSFEGEVKLCDFGIARAMGANSELPQEAIQGKAGYMSPEAASGEALDGRSDVFSAGIMLWEMLAGRRLYKGEDKRPPSLDVAREAVIPELPARGYPDEARLHEIVAKALQKDREARFPSANAMLRDLEAYLLGAGLTASPLRFGEWLLDNFGNEIVELRRARERAAKAIVAGPLVQLSPGLPKPNAVAPASINLSENQSPVPASAAASSELPPLSVARIEPAPPSLEAMVRTSEPEPQKRASLLPYLIVALVLVAAVVVTWLR